MEETNALAQKVSEHTKLLLWGNDGVLYRIVLAEVEKPLIESVLERTEGNQIKAARILGINRNTIRAKIKKLGIDVSRWKSSRYG